MQHLFPLLLGILTELSSAGMFSSGCYVTAQQDKALGFLCL